MNETTQDLKLRLRGHLSGIFVMAALFVAVVFTLGTTREEVQVDPRIQKYLTSGKIDFGNPVDREMFRESLELFYPGKTQRNDSLLKVIDDVRQRRFLDPALKTGYDGRKLTWATVGKISVMYIQFLIIYGVVLVILYFASKRIAIYRFIKMKQGRESYLAETMESLQRLVGGFKYETLSKELPIAGFSFFKALMKGLLLSILFTPAYVIAYSLKTTLDTSSLVFMTILGAASNGVLMHTSNKFFMLLVAESRKGYVQTATVKGLSASYDWDKTDGIPKRALWRPGNLLSSHVFQHILVNARFQFIPTLKEHASFLITGLVIIEMALNIQGHLCYELLQQILYRQYDVAFAIIFGIFLAVKATEITVDVWHDWEKRRYGY